MPRYFLGRRASTPTGISEHRLLRRPRRHRGLRAGRQRWTPACSTPRCGTNWSSRRWTARCASSPPPRRTSTSNWTVRGDLDPEAPGGLRCLPEARRGQPGDIMACSVPASSSTKAGTTGHRVGGPGGQPAEVRAPGRLSSVFPQAAVQNGLHALEGVASPRQQPPGAGRRPCRSRRANASRPDRRLGASKTTLLRVLAASLRPGSRRIELLGNAPGPPRRRACSSCRRASA